MIFGIFLCFLPLIFLVVIFSVTKKLRLSHQVLAVVLGLAAVIPISLIQFFIPDFSGFFRSPVLSSILKCLLLYGLIEECLKAAFILPLPRKNCTCFQFLLLSFVFGLALGCFESVVYFFDHLQKAWSRGAQLLFFPIFLRIFTADVIHLACAGLGGLFVWSCRTKSRPSILITAVLIHGFYDFFAGFTSPLRWFSAAVILLAVAECRIKYVSLQNDGK